MTSFASAKSGKIFNTMALALLSLTVCGSVTGNAQGLTGPRHDAIACSPASQIAPGVWKITIGRPEQITPLTQFKPKLDPASFRSLPPSPNCPVDLSLLAAQLTRRGLEVGLPIGKDEKVYGLGLQLLSFNQTGLKKTLRVNSDPVVDLGDSHAPVPFYVTTGGYGVFIDTARYATFYCGSATAVDTKIAPTQSGTVGLDTQTLYAKRDNGGAKKMVVEIPGAEGVTVLIFAGPGLREAVQRYNLFSGGGNVPPRWALGVWYRTKATFSQDEVEGFATQLRQDNMPCDVLGLEPGWQSHAYSCTHVWKDKFPTPAQLVSNLRAQHYQVNLWTHMFTNNASPIYDKLLPYSGDYRVFGGLVPDFLQPEAVQIFGDHYKKTTIDLGVSGFKMDECDNSDFNASPWSFPEFSRFPSGADGEQMHSLFGLLQQRMIGDLYASTDRRTFGLVRSSGAFASSMPFVLYSDLYDHRQFVRGMVTASFSGLLWTPEIRATNSGKELVRRLQTGAVSAMLNINGWYIKNPPWKQWERDANNKDQLLPNWTEWRDKCRSVLELRMQLVPYLQSAFYRYATDGIPVFRPLVMDYPTASESWTRDDQILIGDRLMAAPMIGNAATRKAWLPPGKWADFWTGEVLEGNRIIEIKADDDHLPLYVKDGSVFPLAHPTLHTEAPESRRLEVRIYGNGSLPATLVEESRPELPFAERNANILELTWNAERNEISSRRKRTDLPPFYSVEHQVKMDPNTPK